MSTEFFNDQWRIPSNENKNKVSNYSMDFDGTSDYIDFTETEFLKNEKASFSFWVKPETYSGTNYGYFFSGAAASNTGIAYSEGSSAGSYYPGVLYWYNGSTSIILDVVVTENVWNHIVIVFDGTSLKTYKDGSLGTTKTITAATTLAFDTIGRYKPTNTHYVNGEIDQICGFDYALSATQVSTLYGGGSTLVNPMSLNPKPILYYQLGDQSADNGANYLSPNGSLQDYVFASGGSLSGSIDLANPVALGTNKTVSFWFKLSSASTVSFSPFTSIVNSGNCYYPYFISSSPTTLKWYVSDSACTGGSSLNIGTGGAPGLDTWAHAAVVGDGSSIKCYLNGVEVQTSANDRNPTIQRLIYGPASQVEFSNFSIFNTNLPATGTESITSLYNNGIPPDLTSYSNIIHWYKLNAEDTFDGTNWTVIDSIGSNNGTSTSMTSANLVKSNLQHTSGYSPYALNFDGTNQEFDIPSVSTLELYNTDFSISFWCKIDASVTNPMFFEKYTGGGGWSLYVYSDLLRFYNGSAWTYISGAFQTVYADLWTNVTIVGDLASTNIKCYINGGQVHSSTNALIQVQNTDILTMAGSNGSAFSYAGGLSNVAIWSGTALSAAEVTEVYNQGAPIDLNTFSGNKPNHWWQMGSNSSFNSSIWTCLDEGISASTSPLTSAVSTANMTNDDIINGPGYSANGVGTSSIVIKGDAPYSTSNALSENMDVLDRTTDVPG